MTDLLASFGANKGLREAVFERIMQEFRLPLDVQSLSNAELGERYRGIIDGAARVEKAFKSMERLGHSPESTAKGNPAR